MSTTPDRTVIVEGIAAIAIVGAGIALASPGDLCLHAADVHPLWIPVILFAARYGARGLFTSAALSALALGGVSMAEHGTLAQLADRGTSPYDMLALVAATLVAWTTGMRDKKTFELRLARRDLARRLAASEETAAAMHEVVTSLRERLDRLDMSVSMWRAIASRLDGSPLPDAAAAALELAAIRSGAAAGLVQHQVGNRLQTIATHGHLPPSKDIARDRTVLAALASRRPALRDELADPTPEDSDVAVAITDPRSGEVLGVLAMRDLPPGQLRSAQVRDLELVAGWLASSFPSPNLRVRTRAC